MTKEDALLKLLPIIGNACLKFSCYHDEMFVYEYENLKKDIFLEVTFIPNDNCGLLNLMTIEDLLDDVNFNEYFNACIPKTREEIA
jgi:hypothetical protein